MSSVALVQSKSTHGFQPGVSGNPGGQPKGFVDAIRKRTLNGLKLVEFVLAYFEDESKPDRERLEAATWLADRGFGKPAQTTLIAAAGPLGAMSLDELIAYREEIRLELAQQSQPALPATTTEAGG